MQNSWTVALSLRLHSCSFHLRGIRPGFRIGGGASKLRGVLPLTAETSVGQHEKEQGDLIPVP